MKRLFTIKLSHCCYVQYYKAKALFGLNVSFVWEAKYQHPKKKNTFNPNRAEVFYSIEFLQATALLMEWIFIIP